jgi:hypothetical protein
MACVTSVGTRLSLARPSFGADDSTVWARAVTNDFFSRSDAAGVLRHLTVAACPTHVIAAQLADRQSRWQAIAEYR